MVDANIVASALDGKPPAVAEWEWLQYLLQRRLDEPTPERKALWFYHIEDAMRAFIAACGE